MAIMIIIIKSHWIMDASGVRLNALRRSFVRKERKWRKYFSYGKKKKKKSLFCKRKRVVCAGGGGGGGGGYGHGGKMTVPYSRIASIWSNAHRKTRKTLLRNVSSVQEVCWWPGTGGIIFINERSWLTVSSWRRERERMIINSFLLSRFICRVIIFQFDHFRVELFFSIIFLSIFFFILMIRLYI